MNKKMLAYILSFIMVLADFSVSNNQMQIYASSAETSGGGTWDCVWFGSYPQDEIISVTNEIKNANYNSSGEAVIGNKRYKRICETDALRSYNNGWYFDWSNGGDSNGYHYFEYQPIKWRILSNENGKALLLSDKVLDVCRYNNVFASVTWENCSLRSYLNSTFLSRAFNQDEKLAIVDSNIDNPSNPMKGTYCGNNTVDKVFALSMNDVTNSKYGFSTVYGSGTARVAYYSDFGYAMGIQDSQHIKKSGWLLRTLGCCTNDVSMVSTEGAICNGNDSVLGAEPVRPAITIDLSSNAWKGAGTVSESGTVNEIPFENYSDNISNGFELGKDNNSFIHSNQYDWCGFYQEKNYEIRDPFIRAKMINLCSGKGETSKILKEMSEEWGGSCYGIAQTIGMVYLEKMKITDVSDVNAENFYSISKKPYQNNKLISVINYYYLSQLLNNYGTKSKYCVSTYYSLLDKSVNVRGYKNVCNNSDFYRKLVNAVKSNYMVLLGYMEKKGSGHAIITCGGKQINDNTYEICLYDENNTGKFQYLTITNNNGKYSALYNGSDALIKELTSMFYVPFSAPITIKPLSISPVPEEMEEEDTITVSFPLNKKIKITNSEGEYLVFDEESIEGDMEIYSINSIVKDDESEIEIEIKDSDYITCTPLDDDMEAQIYSDDYYYSLETIGAEEIDISGENSIEIKGDEYSFGLSVGVDIENNTELFSVEGKSSDDINVSSSESVGGIKMDTEGKLEDVSIINMNFDGEKEILSNVSINEMKIDKEGKIDANIIEQEPTKQEPTTQDQNTKNTIIQVQRTTKVTEKANALVVINKPTKIKKLKLKNIRKKSLVITYRKAKNAKKYRIQISTDKNFKKNIKTKILSNLKYTFKKLAMGRTYYVRVRAINGKKIGDWCTKKKIKIKK